ncbi:MAG: ABC transporter ATP-binding protein [Desulfobulbaceae bacterium]|uniref:ABC transporter ATP-binding protein n=1 Tax=Candidatus Desulfobia pelagia TaxID=2841692 RepID=A0A8J6NFP5_9BACT|nr:ABC transporter ATP-binding protein [Candidatus Desulfobia pelagia]
MALLEVHNINKRFGGLHAVNDVSFSVSENTIKAVIGPNGAGKTTLFNLISRNIEANDGKVFFQNKPIHSLQPYEIAQRGISRTFQNIKLFHGMSALENVMVGCHPKSRAGFLAGILRLPSSLSEEKMIRERAYEFLDLLGIADLAHLEATSLAFGQQRAVEFARALASEPSLLLLDEPAAGLNIYETAKVAKLITKIQQRGITILLVEHDMSLVMDISDEIVVLSFGKKIAEDHPAAIQQNKEVIQIYLGEDDA